jgi:hypothetical protein
VAFNPATREWPAEKSCMEEGVKDDMNYGLLPLLDLTSLTGWHGVHSWGN